MRRTTVLAIIICVIISPEDSHAWGGGAHLLLGMDILGNLGSLPPALAALLSANRMDFLYGSIAADITLGKKFVHYLLNCHRWDAGQKLLLAASTDREKACAYGYLAHLAADVIAHNYYVPYKIMRSFPSVAMKHTYWEIRFDSLVRMEIWDVAREVCSTDQSLNDDLLRRNVAPTIFSFGTNKRIFNSIMTLSRLERWQKTVRSLSERSRLRLTEDDRDHYIGMSFDTVLDLLCKPESSVILNADPTGKVALKAAESARSSLKMLYRSGKMTRDQGMNQVEMFRPVLQKAISRPEALKSIYNG